MILILLFLASVMLFIPVGSSLGYAEIYIIVPDDYSSIQSAIYAAPEGSTILVKPGRYYEQIKVTKPLRIISYGNNTVIENLSGSKTVEIVRGVNNVVFANFLINSSGVASTGLYVGGQNCRIENNTIVGHKIGLCMYDSSGNVLRNNHMFNNDLNLKVWGLFLSHFVHDIDDSNTVDGKKIYYLVNKMGVNVPSEAGYIGVVNSTNVTIENVSLIHNYSGILLAYTSDSVVRGASCSFNEEGLRLVFSRNVSILHSDFRLNSWSGISLIGSSNNIIINNTICQNRNGLLLSYSELSSLRSIRNWIYDNRISENSNAFYFDGAANNYVQNNLIKMNGIALYVYASQDNIFSGNNFQDNIQYGVYAVLSSYNKFWHNNFVGSNSCNVYAQNSVCFWSNDELSCGNYWSIQLHWDQNNDGVNDNQYIIDSQNIDNFPLAYPIVASYAFKLNEKLFSVDLSGNLTLSYFGFDPVSQLIKFNITNSENETIFCKITFPNSSEFGSENRWNILMNVMLTNLSIKCLPNFTVVTAVGNKSCKISSITIDLISEMPSLSFMFLSFLVSALVLGIKKAFKRKIF